MPVPELSKTTANPIRTTLQIGLAATIVGFIHNFAYDMSADQQASATALLTIIISFVQNLIEQRTGKVFLLPNLDTIKQQENDQAQG